jgi:hypothetical protein
MPSHLLFFAISLVHATSFFVPPLPEFTGHAEVVVRATPTKVRTQWIYSERGKAIYTYADLRVRETLRGEDLEFLTVRRPGGTVGKIAQEIPGSVVLREGQESVFFLSGKQEDLSREVLGMELGRLDIQDTPNGTRVSGGILGYGQGLQEAEHDQHHQNTQMLYDELVALIQSQPAPNPATPPAQIDKGDTTPAIVTDTPGPIGHRGESPPASKDEPPKNEAKNGGQESPESSQFKGIFLIIAASLIFFLFMRKKR